VSGATDVAAVTPRIRPRLRSQVERAFHQLDQHRSASATQLREGVVFDRLLLRFRRLVESGGYVMSLHARDEMAADRLTVFDVERCVLTGSIVERQRDRKSGEWKYVIVGWSVSDSECVVIGKLTPTGKLAVLTVFTLDG